ncbi:VHL beta domain-containing protein [Falsiroseomonas selenitidurans]|uniref:von Hippel-Lindau disease tumour suppressor beta domain-containing protein n=1 Tax=Falsiroseomonas selenitidurans TaxID=2716335 RepID=A0ABX1E8S3_9PROT|nr:hypothetical protein [Falsiroseomonas selenitidurans]NKC31300.1 hypothetical protein [Falsiroseomonas selenitidurans]
MRSILAATLLLAGFAATPAAAAPARESLQLDPGLVLVQRSVEPPITGRNCPRPGTRSPGSRQQIRTTFSNANDFQISLYWVDFQGNSVHYGNIRPRGSMTLQSYLGHVWVALDPRGRCLGHAAVPRGEPTLAF